MDAQNAVSPNGIRRDSGAGVRRRATAQPLILDDVESAFAGLSEFGRSVVGPVARSVRTTILLFAAAHQWPVVNHQSFLNWLSSKLDTESTWLVLDPLFPPRALGETRRMLRLSRTATVGGVRIEGELPQDLSELVRGAAVGLVDDVVGSGATLAHAAKLIRDAGGLISRIKVCASRDRGRSGVLIAAPEATWESFVEGDLETAHLRDVCPYLPHAGRKVEGRGSIATPTGSVGVSFPVTAFGGGGPWKQLALDGSLDRAMMLGRLQVAQRFSIALGRSATVADLPLLGTDVSVWLSPNQTGVAESKLEELAGG